MSDAATHAPRAEAEAAAWFARMSRTSVTTAALREFRDWKRDPHNAAAYARVEASWTAAGGLAGDPEIHAATEAALRARPARPRRAGGFSLRHPLWLGVGGVVSAGLAAAALLALRPPEYRTQVGEQRLVVLEDGSRVRLNTDSAIRVRYGRAERRVVLGRGEAFFEAAHNAARPFIVEADGARVRAIGTRFDVRRRADGVQVTLVEGKVRVARGDQGPAATLAPNQQLIVTGHGLTIPVATNAEDVAGWTTGRLNFRATSLAAAVAEVNRYTTHKVVLDGPDALGRQPVSGVFNAGDTAAFVSAVRTLFDLRATTAPDGATHLAPAPASSDG